jgi:hypothetical protein
LPEKIAEGQRVSGGKTYTEKFGKNYVSYKIAFDHGGLHQFHRLLRFAGFLRLRTSDACGRGAPLICSEDPPAIVRKCSLKSSRRIAASCSRLVGCVIGQRLSSCLTIDLPQQPTSRLPQAQPPKAGQ